MIEKIVDYDDILLVPRVNDLESRQSVSLEQTFGSLKLRLPIILSPMENIVNAEMIRLMSDAGGIGILHRFYKDNFMWEYDVFQLTQDNVNFGVSIGLNDYPRLLFALNLGVKLICIDVANGYIKPVRDFAQKVRRTLEERGHPALLMVGNVVTYDGFHELGLYADMIRVGIGSGGLCTTRTVTGVGMPQLHAIVSISNEVIKRKDKAYIIADGGIKSSGDIVKALWAGADLVMIGSLFGRAKESAHNGSIYGMASRKLQEEYFHTVRSVEGIEKEIEKDISFNDLIDELEQGIRSAFTYLGVSSIHELQATDIQRVIIS